ncbi:B12-binding domain-containing radical SAM protein [Lachnospiraceae bacterium NSJ-143]|nr:B12-binding domain-containing radical SAM protein [Lachnospiraceae bacterium NSJ-143]
MRYEGAVYRPPSEAGSLIIQLTIGCARNKCTFCAMFKDKKFRVRKLDEVVADLEEARRYYKDYKVRRIFLADGDALIVKTDDLLYILDKIHELYPECERISAYGAPADVNMKTDEELSRLKAAGLDMIYMGAESGDDIVLRDVKKGVTSEEIANAGIKLKKAGMIVSITLISGLGGRERVYEHAVNSAKLISKIKPEYVGFLTLMVEPGTELYNDYQAGRFKLLGPMEVMQELKVFIENVDSEGTVFRANHASNYVPLKGTFNKDNRSMLEQIEAAEKAGVFRPEIYRGI